MPRIVDNASSNVQPKMDKQISQEVQRSAVFVSIKTTGLNEGLKLIQISARHGNAVFNVYLNPRGNLSKKISKDSGFRIFRNRLFFRNKPKKTVSVKRALIRFLRFLERFSPVVLVAHNCLCFHANVLISFMEKFGLMNQFSKTVHSFVDTLPLLKQHMVKRREAKQSFKLVALAKDFAPESSGYLGNGVHDCKILQEVVKNAGVSDETLVFRGKSFQSVMRSRQVAEERRENLRSLKPLGETLSYGMLRRIAENGIRLEEMISVYSEQGPECLRNYCKEIVNGKPRVSKVEGIINGILQKIATLSNTSQTRSY